MPELRYLDTKYDAAQSGANALQGLAYQLPQLRIAAERLRQQQAVNEAHKILYGAQAKQMEATARYRESQTRLNDNKLADAQNVSQAIRAAGAARAGLYEAQRPPWMANGPTIQQQQDDAITGQMMKYIQNAMVISGNQPQRGEQAIDRTIANVSANVVNNPRLAEYVATGTHIAPWRAGANTALYNPAHPEDAPMLGPTMIPRGGTAILPGSNTPMFGQPGGAGSTLTDKAYKDREKAKAITSYFRDKVNASTTDAEIQEFLRKIDNAYGGSGSTNAPASSNNNNDPAGLY